MSHLWSYIVILLLDKKERKGKLLDYGSGAENDVSDTEYDSGKAFLVNVWFLHPYVHWNNIDVAIVEGVNKKSLAMRVVIKMMNLISPQVQRTFCVLGCMNNPVIIMMD